MTFHTPRLSVDRYERGVIDGDRVTLARAVTLIESRSDEDRQLARDLLQRVLPLTGRAHLRVRYLTGLMRRPRARFLPYGWT